MCHLTKHTAIRTCNTFNCAIRAIDVPFFVHRYISVKVTVLCCNLSVCKELVKPFFTCNKTSLSVGCRIGINSAKLCPLQPWWLVGNNFRVNHLGNMASDGIVGQCRRIRCLSHNFSVRNQTKFNQCLESVTNTKYKTISFVQKFFYCFFEFCILECSCKEFCWTIWFVTSWESAREHDDLGFCNFFFKCIHRIYDICCIHVTEYFCDDLCTCSFKCFCTVILTVCSRKYWDKYCWFCYFILAYIYILCIIESSLHFTCIVCCFCMEYALKFCCPDFDSLIDRKYHIITLNCLFVIDVSNYCLNTRKSCCINYFSNLCKLLNRNFCNDISKSRCKKCITGYFILDSYTKLISKCHLWNCCCKTFSIKSICWNNCSILNHISYCIVKFHYLIIFWKIEFILIYCKEDKLITRLFKFRCDDILFFCHIYCKWYECRRYIYIIKRSRHWILSTDWRKSKSYLCIICSEQCCKWLAPTLWILIHSAEVLLICHTYLLVISTCSNDSWNRLEYCVNWSMVWAPWWKIWIKSISHHCYCITFSF